MRMIHPYVEEDELKVLQRMYQDLIGLELTTHSLRGRKGYSARYYQNLREALGALFKARLSISNAKWHIFYKRSKLCKGKTDSGT